MLRRRATPCLTRSAQKFRYRARFYTLYERVYCAEEPWTHEEKTGRGVLKDNQYQPVRIDSADRVSSNAAREAFASLWHVDKAKLQNLYKLV